MPQSWDSVTSITGKYGTTTLSQINSESINDGEPVSNAGPSAFSVLNNDSELDVAIKSAEIYNGKVKVVYTIPTLAGSHYSYAKLVYKVGTAPTNIYDGTAIDLDPTVTGTSQTVWISGLDLHQTYKFVIFTNKNKSQVATCTYTVVFPKITDISLIAVTRALIKCKIYPEVSESYINIKLIGKKGSVPANISDGTISIDLTVSTTEVEVSNLDENSLYYFEIFIVTDRRTINSYPADIRTGERVLPASTISSMTANYEKVTIRYSIPVLEDDDYDYIKVVFKADSEPTSASDGTVSTLIPYQGEFTKQLSDLTTYYAAIFTRDIYGHEAKSNVMYVTTGQYVVPAATISNISVDQITVTMDCTVPSLPPDRSYHHVSLVGKIGSAPVSESDADVTISDIPLNTTSTQTFTNLDENTTYYFAIFSVDTQSHVTRSNVEDITTGSLLIPPSILELALGERAEWDGSEVEIAWSGQNNKMTAQIDNSQIVFTMYIDDTEIYSFISPVGSSASDLDNIQASFLVDEENQVAKPSFIYYNGSTYSYNQEEPTAEEMANIYLWLNPVPVFEDYWRNVPFENDTSGSDWTPLTLDEEWMNSDEHNWSSIPSTAITNMGTLIHTSKYYQIALSMQDGDEYKDELFNNGYYKVWIELQAMDSGSYIDVDAKLWIQNLHTLHSEHADLNSDVTNYWDDDNQSFYFGFVENSKCTDWESPTSIALALLYHVDMGYCFVDSTVDSGSLYDAFNDDRYDPLP